MNEDNNPPTPNPQASQPTKMSTLHLLGRTLPIGVPAGTPPILAKSFAFKPFRLKEERELDKLRSRKGGAGNHPGKIVQEAMAHMLTEWGDDSSFGQKSAKHREHAIRNAYMADVLYAYVWLRCEAMGPILGLDIECPHCQHEWAWQTNLEGLEVEIVEDYSELTDKIFKLRHGIALGERVYDELVIAPPTWGAVSDIQQNARRGGTGDIKARMIQSCIRGARSTEDPKAPSVTFGSTMLDELAKRDVEELAQFINDAFPSVDLSMEIGCPQCDETFLHSVQWNWDFFFSSSSLPKRTKH